MRRVSLALLAAGCALVTAGCTSAGGSQAPTFLPSPGGFPSEGPGVSISPIVPGPPGGGSGSGSRDPGGSPAPGGSSSAPVSKIDPLVVATKLTTPVGLTMLPDNTALVGERTTGRIVRVQPVAGKPVTTVRTLTGLDTAGDGGLLDLALSPEYSQDNLVYAYISTRTDNRVVEFTLTGPVTPVLTGIPHGRTGNAGRIAFSSTGDLLVATGDAGSPTAAARPTSLAGKVLRVNGIGRPAAGNPGNGSPVWTSGHQGPSALCPVPGSAAVLEVEPGASGSAAEVNTLSTGASYGYPSAGAGARTALATLPSSTPLPGDCAVVANRLWVTSPDGQSVLSSPLVPGPNATVSVKTGSFTATLTRKYGRLLTVVAASDGALWMTTTNRDGKGKPVAADERVIRFMPSSSQSQPKSPV